MKNKKGSVLLIGIIILIGILAVVAILPGEQKTKMFSQELSSEFTVTPIDAKASVSAELVEKDGIAYELLCKSTETKQVPKEESYECNKIIQEPIYKIFNNQTTDNKDIELITGYKDAIVKSNCIRKIYVNETYCIKSGSVKVGDKLISKEGYMCGAGICDEYRDSRGGGGDGNGDGICQAGETCISFEEFVK